MRSRSQSRAGAPLGDRQTEDKRQLRHRRRYLLLHASATGGHVALQAARRAVQQGIDLMNRPCRTTS
jgi:hypothetical protein